MKTVNGVRTDRDPVRPLELSRWQKVIFPLILWSVHQVLNVCTSLWLRICHLWKLCMDLSLPKSTFTQIVAATKMNLTKVPSHIAFGFLERDTNVTMEKVARLVVWAVASGIDYISLYDVIGSLKDQHRYLFREIRKQLSESLGVSEAEIFDKFNIRWHPHNEFNESNYQTVLGNENSLNFRTRNISISLLSCHDGRLDIIKAAQRLAKRISSQLDMNFVNEDEITSALSSNPGFPDPSIFIRLGQSNSSLGFLPWQTRLTEFYDFPCLDFYHFSDYFDHLRKFSNCEQRFGR